MSPIRTESHIIGEAAVEILKRSLPKHWILREQGGNNDYGIDVEIELVQTDGEVTGTIFKGQVKGHKNIHFKNDYYKKSISTDKLKYWLRFSMPVILFEVDTTKEEIFWVDAQLTARREYSYLDIQNSRQIKISSNTKLSIKDKKESQLSLMILLNKILNDYNWRNTYNEVKQYFHSFISFLNIWSSCRYFDFFLEMEHDEITSLKSYYKKTKRLAQTFYIAIDNDDIPLFEDWYKLADEKWDGFFTYSVGLKVCESILKYIIEILEFTKKLVLNLESHFWAKHDLEFQQELRLVHLPAFDDENELLNFLQKYSN
ncbi:MULTISPECIES: DUF4365 domain-containing protein [Bacillaceae]|uniref:DUF4365 domain-containing protein n=1 Tax=Psychrobacillus lasiicapitis TaxID=1636719 RepID=A0A544SQJ7_9BACI|nr:MULTISPECIES: DUF4365 domain-containing protein [Bacillaceae]TQR07475.1 DUF4365 domain-containing protein [Psychrobacillus lasiicapitis]GGA50210.1 hypothetical protein GCM10011384_44790 [Psychrobacillus lasiicapitis]